MITKFDFFGFLADVFLPEVCAFCGCYSKEPICINCRRKVSLSHGKWVNGNDIYEYGNVYITTKYIGVVRKRFIDYKFKQEYSLGRRFGEIMAMNFASIMEKEEQHPVAICYVPISAARIKERGFDQSYELCKVIGSYLKLEVLDIIECIPLENSSRQSSKGRNKRLQSIKGRFVLKCSPDIIKDKNLLLVDDILTTGATLNECASMLRHFGANRIDCMVFASGRGDIT